jgi:erythromycin esterase
MTLAGFASYEDGSPATGGLIAVTRLDTHSKVAMVPFDRQGRFGLVVPPGDYALAAASEQGFAMVEKRAVPDTDLKIVLSRSCHQFNGHVKGGAQSARVVLSRKSRSVGDTFAAPVRMDGTFSLCVPEAYYNLYLTGSALSLMLDVKVPATTDTEVVGFRSDEIRLAPPPGPIIRSESARLVADILEVNPAVIGLGEATHGTAELVSLRSEFTLELIRKADVRLILLEVDAITATALDDYVNGADIDIAKAVTALGFWVTDTYEFLDFLRLVREYNTQATDKVHVWGVDIQDTTHPVSVLVANAGALSIGAQERAALEVASVRRGKGVANLPAEQRASLDALLLRLETPRSSSRGDLLVAVAARSLALQLKYWNGDMIGLYRLHRDSGMASMAAFLISQLHAKRACLWAHAAHLTKERREQMLGQRLATDHSFRFYGVGFYVYEGSVRAWDAAVRIGVISHRIPAAPAYTIEGAIMRATGMPHVAWVALRSLPASFQNWIRLPRFVREIGAGFSDIENSMTLRRIGEAFDAVVVVKNGHDSSPTPTGTRKASRRD